MFSTLYGNVFLSVSLTLRAMKEMRTRFNYKKTSYLTLPDILKVSSRGATWQRGPTGAAMAGLV